MSRNVSGVYALPPGSLVANGDTSDQTDLNTPLTDLEADANVARPIVAGGTGATSASAARTNLGLAIGTDVQAYDADLSAIAGVSSNGLIARTGSGTASARTLTAGAAISITNGDGVSGNPTVAVSGLTTTQVDATTLVDSTDTIASNKSNTKWPTTQAVDDHIPVKLNASGAAPIYAARAWVDFNGVGSTTIKGSGNVSSVTYNAVGDYTINFTTAMSNANYAFSLNASSDGTSNTVIYSAKMISRTASAIRIWTLAANALADFPDVSVVIFR